MVAGPCRLEVPGARLRGGKAVAIVGDAGPQQIGIAVRKGGPADPTLVLTEEDVAAPAHEIGIGAARERQGGKVVQPLRHALDARIGTEDAAVEPERKFAALVACRHVAVTLVIPAHLRHRIIRVAAGPDEHMRAAPEFVPAFLLVRLGFGECRGFQQLFGAGGPLRGVRVLRRAQRDCQHLLLRGDGLSPATHGPSKSATAPAPRAQTSNRPARPARRRTPGSAPDSPAPTPARFEFSLC